MATSLPWLELFENPVDVLGLALFLVVFPIYHTIYPFAMRRFPAHAAKTRIDQFRRSWIVGLLARGDLLVAVQTTRNLTMVNSLLASSALILMGLTANLMIRAPLLPESVAGLAEWSHHPEGLQAKLFLLIVVFAVAFGYCMTSLRHLGHFTLVIGADPELVREHEGPPEEYFTALINRASNRYTMAVRCFYSASPLLLWIFDRWFFIGLTLFWAIKFIGFQDFSHVVGRRARHG